MGWSLFGKYFMFSSLSTHLTDIVKNLTGRGRLTEENIQESLNSVRHSLLEADVPLKVIETFLDNIKSKAIGQKVLTSLRPGDELIKIVYEELVALLGNDQKPLNLQANPPIVIMIVGLQGSGKTTTASKLAYFLKNTQKKSILLASVDIYRPAAREQLQVLANQIQVNYFEGSPNDKPIAIAKAAVDHAKRNLIDIVIIDTAGRLHIDQEMMDELKHLDSQIVPLETLLVVDSMMGQDAINIANAFTQDLRLTGVVLSKADGDARGGAAIAMRLIANQPIKFIGTGEKIDALEQFYPDRFASRILGMGDILSLVEEAYQKVDQKKVKKLAQKFQKGQGFDLEDFRSQLQQMRNLGGIKNLLDKLPGGNTLAQMGNVVTDKEKDLKKMEAIINSMTPRERHFPAFIKGSHKQRIAKGSGTVVQDVNRLLKQFDQMQKMMQRFKGSKMSLLKAGLKI
jgi:signal recognition particle subunit SRP54